MEKYTETYFKDNVLIMILAEENSGSNRHKVTGITSEDGVLFIQVERLIPQVGTTDMAQWHLLVEIDQDNWTGQELRVQFSEKKS